MFMWFVLLSIATTSATIATIQEGEAGATTRVSAACTTDYAGDYGEKYEGSDYDNDDYWPFAI